MGIRGACLLRAASPARHRGRMRACAGPQTCEMTREAERRGGGSGRGAAVVSGNALRCRRVRATPYPKRCGISVSRCVS
eukprot:230845-Prymnesium_polylepis.1